MKILIKFLITVFIFATINEIGICHSDLTNEEILELHGNNLSGEKGTFLSKSLDVYRTSFDPIKHSFKFDNNWKEYGLLESWGLCGGMVLSALDFFHAGCSVAHYDRPAINSDLYRYIWTRQVPISLTLVPYYFIKENLLPILDLSTPKETDSVSTIYQLKQNLSKNNPVPILLIGRTGQPINSHVILGYELDEISGRLQRAVSIKVYDPNRPSVSNSTLDIVWDQRTGQMKSIRLSGYKINWVTLIPINYSPQKPKGLCGKSEGIMTKPITTAHNSKHSELYKRKSQEINGKSGNTSTVMYNVNPQHTGVFNTKAISKIRGFKWTFKTVGTVRTSPSVLGKSLYFGCSKGKFYALDKKNGRLQWTFQTNGDGAIDTIPAIVNGIIYFGSNDGYFYSIDARTGKEKWKFQTAGLITTHPVISNECVIFGCASSIWSPSKSFVVSLNLIDGSEKWKFKLKKLVESTPAVFDGIVYFGSHDHIFYAVDIKNGELAWSFKSSSKIELSPCVSSGNVYFGCGNKLFALDAKTGLNKWKFSSESEFFSSPVLNDRILYISGIYLSAIDKDTGKLIWKFKPIYKKFSSLFASISIAQDILYFGCIDYLYAIKTNSGDEIWKIKIENSRWYNSPPTIHDGMIYLGIGKDRLYALW